MIKITIDYRLHNENGENHIPEIALSTQEFVSMLAPHGIDPSQIKEITLKIQTSNPSMSPHLIIPNNLNKEIDCLNYMSGAGCK